MAVALRCFRVCAERSWRQLWREVLRDPSPSTLRVRMAVTKTIEGAWKKSVPQRLKPRCEQSRCGTAKAVPLSKTDFFSIFSAE
jgi:hypothetical protein